MVEEQKLTGYLLSDAHTEGGPKADGFSRFGFSHERWQELALALREHIASHPVSASAVSQFGVRYVVEGIIKSPDGRNPQIRSVWIIEADGGAPRLVTAYLIERGV